MNQVDIQNTIDNFEAVVYSERSSEFAPIKSGISGSHTRRIKLRTRLPGLAPREEIYKLFH